LNNMCILWIDDKFIESRFFSHYIMKFKRKYITAIVT